MNKEYPKSVIEIKAKELLLPIKANCQDSVWQEINYHLNEHTSTQKQWVGKPGTVSKIVAGSVVLIGVIGLLVWKFSDKIGGWTNNKAAGTTLFQNKKTTVVKSVTSVPPPKPAVVADTAHNIKPPIAKDTITPIKNVAVAVNMPPLQNVALKQPLANTKNTISKRDSLLVIRRNAAIRARHFNDSVALAAKTVPKTDSVLKVSTSKAVAHDSVSVAKTDSAGN